MTDLAKPGQVVDAPKGLRGKYVCTNLRYDYSDKTKLSSCRVCDGFGAPWDGWMQCEKCEALHWIETGEVFAKVAISEIGA